MNEYWRTGVLVKSDTTEMNVSMKTGVVDLYIGKGLEDPNTPTCPAICRPMQWIRVCTAIVYIALH